MKHSTTTHIGAATLALLLAACGGGGGGSDGNANPTGTGGGGGAKASLSASPGEATELVRRVNARIEALIQVALGQPVADVLNALNARTQCYVGSFANVVTASDTGGNPLSSTTTYNACAVPDPDDGVAVIFQLPSTFTTTYSGWVSADKFNFQLTLADGFTATKHGAPLPIPYAGGSTSCTVNEGLASCSPLALSGIATSGTQATFARTTTIKSPDDGTDVSVDLQNVAYDRVGRAFVSGTAVLSDGTGDTATVTLKNGQYEVAITLAGQSAPTYYTVTIPSSH